MLFKRLLFVLLLLALIGIGAAAAWEMSFRGPGLDWQMIEKVLYYQMSDSNVYQASEDPVLHYHLKPGADGEGGGFSGKYTVHVNAWGARGPEREAEKPTGVQRILYFGGSTIFGANVSDHQTMPARLEEALLAAGGQVEVWNYGHSAYVLTQMARLARLKMAEVPEVDALVLTITNAGRRAFIDPAQTPGLDYGRYFEEDEYLWLENFPAPKIDGLTPAQTLRLHLMGLHWSAGYRYWIAFQLGQTRDVPLQSAWTRAISAREVEAMEAEAAALGIQVIYANYPNLGSTPPHPQGTPMERVIDLTLPDQEELFYEIHPPPRILKDHAYRLADEMIARGMVEVAPAEAPGARDGADGAPH